VYYTVYYADWEQVYCYTIAYPPFWCRFILQICQCNCEFFLYRFQSHAHIVQFFGVTANKGKLYHVIEPLSCSLRHYISKAAEGALDVPDRRRFSYLKTKLIQLIKGLDYLHDRGWVHYDLSLDTVAVSFSGNVFLDTARPGQS